MSLTYSDQQRRYIKYTRKKDTKLIACAGSGKTFCIIHRLKNLLSQQIYTPNQILVLTFSRFTCNDFLRKMGKHELELPKEQVRTIDSFAKEIIDAGGSNTDVNILSYSFMKYLQLTPAEDLQVHERLSQIQSIFIDEAQDLNETQFQILSLMREKLGCVINMIGDPNQNIFQFRASSDQYLKEFAGKEFYLTKNYRSFEANVLFSQYLRPYQEQQIQAHRTHSQPKWRQRNAPWIFVHSQDDQISRELIQGITSLQNQGIDLSRMAILAPSKGRLSDTPNKLSKGLCFIANILTQHEIPFCQFYDEGRDAEKAEIQYRPQPQHINLLTYHGSKGLEWDYVFLMDSNFGLVNYRTLTPQRHQEDRYLLYVACSRAIRRMFIYSTLFPGSSERKKADVFHLNPWFQQVPKEYYSYRTGIGFADEKYQPPPEDPTPQVTEIIQRLSEEQLYLINQKIQLSEPKITELYEETFTDLENPSPAFLGKLGEFLFHYQYAYHHQEELPKLDYVEEITQSQVIYSGSKQIQHWWRDHKKISWEEYDQREWPPKINNFVQKYFDRKQDFDHHSIQGRQFYDQHILKHRKVIQYHYVQYRLKKPWKEAINSLFYLVLLKHSLETNHLCYIHQLTRNQTNPRFSQLLDAEDGYYTMFERMDQWVQQLSQQSLLDHHVLVEHQGLLGEVDLVGPMDQSTLSTQIHEIKCVQQVNLRHQLQLLIYSGLSQPELLEGDPQTQLQIPISVFNFLQGEHREWTLSLTRQELNEIFGIFYQVGKLNETSGQQLVVQTELVPEILESSEEPELLESSEEPELWSSESENRAEIEQFFQELPFPQDDQEMATELEQINQTQRWGEDELSSWSSDSTPSTPL